MRMPTASLLLAALLLCPACGEDVTPGQGEGADTSSGDGRGRDDRTSTGDTGEDLLTDAARDVLGGADTGTGGTLPQPQILAVPGAQHLHEAFEAATESASAGPAIVYPETGTLFPRNVAATVFQWEGPTNDAYRLRITNENTHLVVYTTSWNWLPDEPLWRNLANSNPSTPLTLQASQLVGGSIESGDPITIEFSTAEVSGAIYYWSPGQNGIMRLEVGATQPEPFLVGTVFNCTGCHALSPDGSRVAYTQSNTGTPIGPLGVIGTDDARNTYVSGGSGYYPSFAPDNVHLAVADGGGISVIDTDSGAVVDPVPMMTGYSANYPAWSPNDDAIVYSAGSMPAIGGMAAVGMSAAGLVRVPREAGAWGTPGWLVPRGGASTSDENLFYPAFSPDGAWVAFNRADGESGAGAAPSGAELWVVAGAGGTPVRLDRANGSATNSWAKWAPATEDGRLWLAFTSTRPYGRIATESQQIWIAGLTAEEARNGRDPSAAAFWMPFQALDSGNHIPYWAEFSKDDVE